MGPHKYHLTDTISFLYCFAYYVTTAGYFCWGEAART